MSNKDIPGIIVSKINSQQGDDGALVWYASSVNYFEECTSQNDFKEELEKIEWGWPYKSKNDLVAINFTHVKFVIPIEYRELTVEDDRYYFYLKSHTSNKYIFFEEFHSNGFKKISHMLPLQFFSTYEIDSKI